VKSARPTIIVHTAAQPSHDRAAQIPFDDFDTNAVGTLTLLEAARRWTPESPFTHMSTNKVYGDRPNMLSAHFNLTVELPLKAVIRGYSWTVIPITWRNRRTGLAKLKIQEMGSRYLFICLYLWLEKYLSRGDYKKRTT